MQAAEQIDQQQDRNRHSEQPEQCVASHCSLPLFLRNECRNNATQGSEFRVPSRANDGTNAAQERFRPSFVDLRVAAPWSEPTMANPNQNQNDPNKPGQQQQGNPRPDQQGGQGNPGQRGNPGQQQQQDPNKPGQQNR